MPKIIQKTSNKAGLSPGTIVYVGKKKTKKVKIELIDFNESQFQEKEIENIEDCFPFKDTPTITWINISGLHQTEILEKIGKQFGVHPLVLEDIVHTTQRPKTEDFESYLFVVLKRIDYNDKIKEINVEQLSMIIGSNFVISFQETEGNVFNPVRQRIRNGKGKTRKLGSDYLAYSLIDAVVDNYFIILEKLGGEIEEIEEELIQNPKPEILNAVHRLKRQLIFLRKSVWPLREVISNLQRGESKLIKKTTGIYLRDVYDHTIQVIDTVETFRDMTSGMLDVYLSSVSNKMNEVMKVLTIIATIFIPMTFVAGMYGMNFEFMPELKWEWSYPLVWLTVIIIAGSMLLYFRRKKWI
ncbi:MAG: magnesium/cobalt transporter CorA [archaeon]|nr:magnesium/cobalt transporter CorA [Candidatus Micrarchaeota archaeon]